MNYRIFKLRFIIIIAGLFVFDANAQLSLSVREIDARAFPTIRLKTMLSLGNLPVAQPGHASYLLTENGMPQLIDVACPDASQMNSVMLVLDNSASMGGDPITALEKAASMLIDSLRVGDEAGIISISPYTLVQDFTNDKNVLHAALASLTVGGPTPMYDAMYAAIQKLSGRPGKKVCVAITDGVDNASSINWPVVSDLAVSDSVILFTIGFGNDIINDKVLGEMALRTGGRYFRIFGTSEMDAVFNAIASDIISTACTITYTAGGCTDSLRFLHLEASLDGQRAVFDTLYHSPYRMDSLRLSVIAPDEISSGATVIVYVALDPGLHGALVLSFDFLLHYDAALLELNPTAPITVGTITQNAQVGLSVVRKGVLRFSAADILPGMTSGNLVGVRFKGLAADSSRPVILTIDSVTFTAGCPNVIIVQPDTIDVCQCNKKLAAWCEAQDVAESGSQLRIRVCIADTSLTNAFQFTSFMSYDQTRLTPLYAAMENPASKIILAEDIIHPGLLRIIGQSRSALQDSILFTSVFQIEKEKNTEETVITLPLLKAYSTCCMTQQNDTGHSVILDGICQPLVVKRSVVSLHRNIPNPGKNHVVIPFDVHAGANAMTPISITVYDQKGNFIVRLANGSYAAGSYLMPFDSSRLSSGTYYCVLEADDELHVVPVTIAK